MPGVENRYKEFPSYLLLSYYEILSSLLLARFHLLVGV